MDANNFVNSNNLLSMNVKTLNLMVAKLSVWLKTLNILAAKLNGFTVCFVSYIMSGLMSSLKSWGRRGGRGGGAYEQPEELGKEHWATENM